jgi:signal recognition particle subunit SRP54
MLSMIPGVSGKVKDVDIDEKALNRQKAIIQSMTPEERANPDILNPSRKNRIAKGAGVPIADVNRLVKQFEQSKKMMKQFSGMMNKGRMGGRGGLLGGLKLPF